MGTKSLPLKFMFVFSLSLTVSSSFHFPLLHQPISSPLSIKSFSSSSFSSSSPPKASATDLLSVLGPKDQASTINPKEAEELKSCLKFLVPFSPTSSRLKSEKFLIGRKGILKDDRRSTVEINVSSKNPRFENELVWWPPKPVLELARIAMDSGGDPGAIHRTLDPTVIPVPDVEGSNLDRCELTRTPYGRRFISEELNSYMEFLFKLIAVRGPTVGLHVSLSRFDLFHGHLFLAKDSRRLGILFHAKEYPAYEEDVFPYNLGYCQIGSNMVYDSSMNLRNILWLAPLPSNSTRAWVSPAGDTDIQRVGGLAKVWCIANPVLEPDRLKEAIDYYCRRQLTDCRPIMPGGDCYEPNTVYDHASVVLNTNFKATGAIKENCWINSWGMVTVIDPSNGKCIYP